MDESLAFLSDRQIEKNVYYKEGTVTIVGRTDYHEVNIPHSVPQKFVPSISYTRDGTNWYRDGAGEVAWASANNEWQQRVTATASASNNNVRVVFVTGNFGTQTINYKIYGLALDV